jgi:hypothetical protein
MSHVECCRVGWTLWWSLSVAGWMATNPRSGGRPINPDRGRGPGLARAPLVHGTFRRR